MTTPERSVEEILEGLRCETCSEERQFGSPPNSDANNLYVYTDLSGATRVFCKDHMTYFKDGKFPALSYNDDWNGVGYGAGLLSDVIQTLQAERQKREEVVKEALKEAGNYVDELYQTGNMGENEYMLLTDFFVKKLKTKSIKTN